MNYVIPITIALVSTIAIYETNAIHKFVSLLVKLGGGM